jgi:4'-phosphopantetheinyl transferase
MQRGRELGVDLEYTDAHPEEGIAERFFSPREAAALRGLPPPERREAFFACWTRKEAYLKARGDGLALHLDRFDVSGTPTEPAAILYPEGYRDEERWSLTGLAVPPPYAAALCVEGCLPSVTYRQWT